MTEAWIVAARHLVFVVRTDVDVASTSFPILIENFGSPNGTLPVIIGDLERFAVAQQTGFFAVQLNPDCYLQFDRDLFIDTLNDWGWFGPGAPPDWYTGKAWT